MKFNFFAFIKIGEREVRIYLPHLVVNRDQN